MRELVCVDGAVIAHRFIGAMKDPVYANQPIDFSSDWEDELASIDAPAPLARLFISSLFESGNLSPNQAVLVAEILSWYDDFWTQYKGITSSRVWQSSILATISDYALQRRAASFRPYYEDLIVDPVNFIEWQVEWRASITSIVQDKGSWRGPITSARRLCDSVGAIQTTSEFGGRRDYHSCGSPSFLLMGDTGHAGFDQSICWICPGIDAQACGGLLVDVRD